MVVNLYFYAIGILLAGVLNTLFGFSVYIKNRKNLSCKTYGLLSLAFAVWCYSWLAMLLVKNNETFALFFARLLNFGAVFIPAFYFHWVLSILEIEKENKRNIWACYIITIFFAFLSWTSLYIKGVHPVLFFPFWPTAGFIYIFYLIFAYFTFPAYSVYLLFKKLYAIKEIDKIRINQLKYVLLGSFMGFGGGALNFFLMYDINLFGPFFEAGIFVVLLVFVPFAVPLAYATMKYHLMDIKIVFTEIAAGLTSTTLLLDTVFSFFTSVSPLVIMFKFVVFIVFSFFGVMLIRSVLREIEQRERIEKIEKEVERAYEVEKKANAELEKLDKLKNQFMMTIQHHLKTPLTSIMGYSDLLLNGTFGKQNKKTVEVAERLQDTTTGLIKMVNEFLDITQFQMGKGVVNLKPGVDIAPMVEQIVGELKFQADKKGLYLKLEKPENTPLIKTDLEKLKAALFNIFDNSIKYTEKGGVTIEIQNPKSKIQNENGKLQIIVKDTGIGMPQERINKLFGVTFDRGDEAKKTNASGRGIGLYLSSEIIKAHNGRVWAESDGEGKGSTFFIELPLS